MKTIENKKTSVTVILISIIGIIIGYLIKDSYNKDGSIHSLYVDVNYPLKYYEIYVFGYLIEYTHFLSVMLLILGLGIYCFLFKSDEEIKNSLNKLKTRFKINKLNENIGNGLANFKNRFQKIKMPMVFKNVAKNTKNFYLLGKSNKIENVAEIDKIENREIKKNMFKTPFSFKGRIRRTEYGLSLLIVYMISFVIAPPGNNYNIFILLDFSLINTIIFISVIGVIVGWFFFAQGAKRCHDMNCNGWYQLIPFYIIWMLFGKGDDGKNKYGLNPKEMSNKKLTQNKTYKIFRIVLIIFSILLFFIVITKMSINSIGLFNSKVEDAKLTIVEDAKLTIAETARKMNELVPLKSDEYTTLIKVEYEKNKFYKYYEITGINKGDISQQEIDNFIETTRINTIKVLKENPVKNKSFVDASVKFVTIYTYTNGEYFCSFEIEPIEYSN